jgi:hypothetical protein
MTGTFRKLALASAVAILAIPPATLADRGGGYRGGGGGGYGGHSGNLSRPRRTSSWAITT